MRADNEWDFRGVRCRRYDWIEYDERGEAENRKTTFEAVVGEGVEGYGSPADLCPYSCDERDLETWLLAGCPKRTGHGSLTKGDLAYLLVIRRAQELVEYVAAERRQRAEIVDHLHESLNSPGLMAIKNQAWPNGPRNPFPKPARSTDDAT